MKIRYLLFVVLTWSSVSNAQTTKVQWLLKPTYLYNNVWDFDAKTGLAMTSKNKKIGLINSAGVVVVPPTYDYYIIFYEDRAKVRLNNLTGYIDTKGKLITPIKFSKAYDFEGGVALVQYKTQWQLINKQGKLIAKLPYKNVSTALAGIFKVTKNGKSGFVDTQGKLIIPFRFTNVNFIGNTIYAHWQDKNKQYHHGLFDKTGKLLVNLDKYGQAFRASEGKRAVSSRTTGKFGFVNKQGQLVIPHQYDMVSPFEKGVARVNSNKLYWLIDHQGKAVSKKYDAIDFFFYQGLAKVQKGNKFGFIDRKGKEIVPVIYDRAEDFKQGTAVVFSKSQALILDPKGKVIGIPGAKYTGLNDFHEGLVKVKQNGKYGYMDMNGKIVIDYQFRYAQDFSTGKAPVQLNGKWGIIKNPFK